MGPMNESGQEVVNLREVEEFVDRFFVSYEPGHEPSAEELAKISEDARQALELSPPSDCVEWWSALPLAVRFRFTTWCPH